MRKTAKAAILAAGFMLPLAAVTPTYAFSLYLYQGVQDGSEVQQLQSRLNQVGYHLVVDGLFGPATLAAVQDFQGKHGLATDGIVGPLTTAALDKALQPAPASVAPAGTSSGPTIDLAQGVDNASAVRALQQRLNALGYGVAVDGLFGPQTDAAVRRFQQEHGLAVDGIVGPVTHGALTAATPRTAAVSVNASQPAAAVRLSYPLPQHYVVTSPFGYRTNPVTGAYTLHAGVDLGAPYGTPILAAAAGTVTYAGWDGGYGNLVIIDHGNGLETRYAHQSQILVQVGQAVSRGQTIGRVGATGQATGPHLHFEVRVDGEAKDPAGYMALN